MVKAGGAGVLLVGVPMVLMRVLVDLGEVLTDQLIRWLFGLIDTTVFTSTGSRRHSRIQNTRLAKLLGNLTTSTAFSSSSPSRPFIVTIRRVPMVQYIIHSRTICT